MSAETKNKIALVCCYFGSWPKWMPFFCESIAANPTIDVVFFSDCGPVPQAEKYPNIKVNPYTFNQLISAVETELGFKTGIHTIRQVCNLKPVYGSVFREYLSPYAFWGQIDIDLIYGNIGDFISEADLSNFDIISANHSIASGHFCLFKNEERIHRLYKELPYLKEYLLSDGYSLDECVLGGHIHSHQYLKQIKFRFKEVIYDDHLYALRGRERFALVVDRTSNEIFDPLLGKSFMYFHFQEAKKREQFRNSFPEKPYNRYLISYKGVSKLSFNGAHWLSPSLWLALFSDLKWLAKYRVKRFLGIEPFRGE